MSPELTHRGRSYSDGKGHFGEMLNETPSETQNGVAVGMRETWGTLARALRHSRQSCLYLREVPTFSLSQPKAGSEHDTFLTNAVLSASFLARTCQLFTSCRWGGEGKGRN